MEKNKNYQNFYILWASTLFLFFTANAANEVPQTFTLDGQLNQKVSSEPLLDSSVAIVVQILDPSKNCILYEEQQTVDTTTSNGYFSIQVGSSTGAIKRTANDAGNAMAQIFQNTTSIVGKDASGRTCPVDGGTSLPTYVPTAKDSRFFRLIVTPSSTSTADTLTPDVEMGSMPSSLVAQTFQGYVPTQFLFVGTGDLTQANLQSVFATGNAAKLNTLLATDPNLYLARNATSGLVQLPSGTGTPTGVASGQMWYDSGSIKYFDGSTVNTLGLSGDGVISIVAGTGLTGGTITSSGTIAVDVGTTAGKIVQLDGSAKLPAVDGSALTNLNAGNIASGTLPIARGGTNSATALNNDRMMVSSGGAIVEAGAMTNGQLLIGSTGAAPVVAAITAGSGVSITNGAGSITIATTGAAPTGSAGGDLSGTYPNPAVAKLNGVAMTISSLTSGQFLKYNGTDWVNVSLSTANLSDGGNLINAGQMPANCASGETLTFSSPTGTWTCSAIVVSGANFANQSANVVLAGPSSGGAAAPTFRSLASADIPNLDAAKITTGTLAVANGGTGTATGSITGTGALTFAAGGANQNVTLTPSGTGYTVLGGSVGIGTTAPATDLTVTSKSAGANSVIRIANDTTATGDMNLEFYRNSSNKAGIGLRPGGGSTSMNLYDNHASGSISFSTGTTPTERMRISASGNVGIGTTSPSTTLDVRGSQYLAQTTNSGAGSTVTTFQINPLQGYYNRRSIASSWVTGGGAGYVDSNLHFTYDSTAASTGNGTPSTEAAAIAISQLSLMHGGNVLIAPNSGNVGIGTINPQEQLSVSGVIESMSGGFKFPDGTTQATAANGISGLQSAKIPMAITNTTIGDSQITDNGISGVDFANYKITFGGTINTFLHTGTSATVTNSFVGIQSGNSTMTGTQNNIVGGVAFSSNTTGWSNNGMGYNVLYQNTTGGLNSAIGEAAMSANTTGNFNVGIGWGALSSENSGTFNTAIGSLAGLMADSNSSGNVFIGANAGPSTMGPISNKLYIANNSGVPLIYGDFSAGFVGIGTTTPGYKLDVSGTINIASGSALAFGGTSVCTAAGCTSSSDERLKENIKPLDFDLNKLLSLNAVQYDWKNKSKYGDKHQIGFIAQNLEQVYPEVVYTDKNTGLKSVTYGHLVAPVIEALKSIYKRLLGLEAHVDRQIASIVESKADKAEIEVLREKAAKLESKAAKVDKLEAENAALKSYLCSKDPAAPICK